VYTPLQERVRFLPPPHTDSNNPSSTGRSEARSHDRPDGLTDGRTPNPENLVDNPALRRLGCLGGQQSSMDSENPNLSGTAKLWGGVLAATSAALIAHGMSVVIRDIQLPSWPKCYSGALVESNTLMAAGITSSLFGLGAIFTGLSSKYLPAILDSCIQNIRNNSPDADTAQFKKHKLILATATFALAACVEIPVLEIFEQKGLREEKSSRDAANKNPFINRPCGGERYVQISPPSAQVTTPPSHLANFMVPAPASWQVIEPRHTPEASAKEPASKT
jgi:hypothetical protein